MDDDVDVVRTGGRSDFQYPAQELYPPGPVDRVLHDGEHVRFGELDLEALKTPGHTRGCTAWRFQVHDGPRPLEVMILCSINLNPGYRLVDNAAWPDIAAAFEHTYAGRSTRCGRTSGLHLTPSCSRWNRRRRASEPARIPSSIRRAIGTTSRLVRASSAASWRAKRLRHRPRTDSRPRAHVTLTPWALR